MRNSSAFRNGPLGVKSPRDRRAAGSVLPSGVGAQAATPCHQKGAGGPIYDTCSAAKAFTALCPAAPIPRPGDGTSAGQD